MSPVDVSMPVATMQSGAVPGAGTIPLSTLIEYIVQRTYHEVTVLSELLPRRTDIQRKVDIVQFASRTRNLFIRLLALVKWANSASKVDKCGAISSFLDQQAMLFVETADSLARMSRETLVNARLPTFFLPCAIDVLTMGSYPRLPSCIKERIVPPDPITPIEKKETLQHLNQIIQYRLVTSELPTQLRNLSISNGRVKFVVEHEFEVTLTLMGDGPTIPWRLLDIEFLVEDLETGDGKGLVHSLQINYIHQLQQSRLLENERPLHDLYNCLHSFCLSLQLEVMQSQAQRLMRERLGEHIWIEQYVAGKCLVLSYWRTLVKRDKDITAVNKLSVHIDEADSGNPLQVTHTPSIPGRESYDVAKAIRSDQLSIEKLLIQTILVRSRSKLKIVSRDLKKHACGPCEICGEPPVLYIPILHPCMESERLTVSIDIQKGCYIASVLQYSYCKITEEIEEYLNEDKLGVETLFSKLRIWLCLQRCEKSVRHLPTTCSSRIPLVYATGHPISNMGTNKVYIQLTRHPDYYLIVEVEEGRHKRVTYKYHLLKTVPSTFETEDRGELIEDITFLYVKPKYMVSLDTFTTTHGPTARIYTEKLEDIVKESRPEFKCRKVIPDTPAVKLPPYFIPEMAHVVSACEERIPFIALGAELEKHDFKHQGISVDDSGSCLSLTILDFPQCEGCSRQEVEAMKKNILMCKFRCQSTKVNPNQPRMWTVEMMFVNNLLKSKHNKEQGPVQRVFLAYDQNTDGAGARKTVGEFTDDLSALCHLHSVVQCFADIYSDSTNKMSSYIEVTCFNFMKITLSYGPQKCYNVTVLMKSNGCQTYHVTLGTDGLVDSPNPHRIVVNQLKIELNQSKSLAQLAQICHETWSPLSAISKLPTSSQLGLTSKFHQAISSFSILPQSSTHIRIFFRNLYCLDVYFRDSKAVAIRDGAYGVFDNSMVVEGCTPTQGLKAFLNMYVDDTLSNTVAQRRRSTTEDDNPPSPIGMDTFDTFMSQSQSFTGSPLSKSKPHSDGVRFASPLTPPTPSAHPLTPASPNTARLSTNQQMGYSSSPAGNFSLASPPSAQQSIIPSPVGGVLSAPSPGTLLSSIGSVGSPASAALHVPSPGPFVPAPSPSSMGIHMPSPAGPFVSPHGMVEGGSPYPTTLTMPSPGTRNWPGSPSVPTTSPAKQGSSPGYAVALHSPLSGEHSNRHTAVMSPLSRMLPQRAWAASVPTLLSHDALQQLLTPSSMPAVGHPGVVFLSCSPLERFLGCMSMRRQLPRILQAEPKLQSLPVTEPGVLSFRSDSLQFRVACNPQTMQTLHLKVTKLADNKEQCPPEELQVLEQYFETKVACAPFKLNALWGFGKLLSAPYRILKECVNVIRLDMNTIPEHNAKWSLELCLTMPPDGPSISPAGSTAVVLRNNKILLILQLTRVNVSLPSGAEPQTIVVPIVHDITNNITNYAERNQQPASQASQAISALLKRLSEVHQKTDCTLFPAIREICMNLVLPM